MIVPIPTLGWEGQFLGGVYAAYGALLVLSPVVVQHIPFRKKNETQNPRLSPGRTLLGILFIGFGAVVFTTTHDASTTRVASSGLYKLLLGLLAATGIFLLLKLFAVIAARKDKFTTHVVVHAVYIAGTVVLMSVLWLLLDERIASNMTYDAYAVRVLGFTKSMPIMFVVLAIVAKPYDMFRRRRSGSSDVKPSSSQEETRGGGLTKIQVPTAIWSPRGRRAG